MISIVIPTLNEEKVLHRTLSRLSEYDAPKEIIISDGISTDTTHEIAKKHNVHHLVVHDGKKKQNIAMGRNAGAEKAKHDFIVFIDADVIIPEINTFFKKALEVFAKNPEVVALTVFYRVLPEHETLADKIIFKLLGYNFLFSNNIMKKGMSGGEFQMIRKEAFKKVGGFNESLAAAEDTDLFRRLAKVGRTHFVKDLHIFHTGRRAHKIGWPKLLTQWVSNDISVRLFKKSVSKEWTVIR